MTEKCLSADGVELTNGMEIWVNHHISGFPPKRRWVGTVVSPKKFLYMKQPRDDYAGCKADCAWVSLRKAMEYALEVLGEYHD